MNSTIEKKVPVIQAFGITKTYRTGAGDFQALRGVDLEIQAGEFVALVGKSGSGKSTLLNLLTGIDRVSSGEIMVNGQAIHGLNEAQLTTWRGRNMGVVFQFFQLIPTLTIVENIMLPMDFCRKFAPQERKARAMKLLENVGIAEQANKLPSALSGGEQQRAAIARALANDPGIIMADEPTGNLDSQTTAAVFELFQGLVRLGKTVVMVTHNQDLAMRSDRMVQIHDGRIICDSSNRTQEQAVK